MLAVEILLPCQSDVASLKVLDVAQHPCSIIAQTQFPSEETLGYWPFRRADTGK
jgi:hypothetical protein